ncbi:MAG: DNA recombination protein RmuC [Bacteroidetes bacterium]|nr:DNA recombination protein RmuC [Bacteroidota bacterium]
MTLSEILLLILILLVLINLILQLTQKKEDHATAEVKKLQETFMQNDQRIQQAFSVSRNEMQQGGKVMREELMNSFNHFSQGLTRNFADLSKTQEKELKSFSELLQALTKSNEEKMEKLIGSNENKQVDFKTQLTLSLKSFEENFVQGVKDFNELQRQKFFDLSDKQEKMRHETMQSLDKIRETLEQKIRFLQEENTKKLEEMRKTVDEKLQATLEKRFNDSFTLISSRLEQVHKGLGEMQSLAVNVGDLRKVMTNVKSRGVLGEYQLANILEDLLTNDQYGKNIKTKRGSGAMVEFAIRMPNHSTEHKVLWLPIDSKFPKEDYEALVDAYETGDPAKIESLRKSFRAGILKNAKDIKEKYIDPPNTTEYGIMFLPFESLYAEVLRNTGLFETLQKEYKITVTGPATLSALLNALQMGFRTLAIEKRSSEVWDLLSKVKSEFNLFGNILEKTKKKLQDATNTIDQAGTRSRAIERQLKKVQELPQSESTPTISATQDENEFTNNGDNGLLFDEMDEEE